MSASKKQCKDCGAPGRKAPHPGPRCTTHHRTVIAARREAVWAAYLVKTYSITPEFYWALYEAQGGVCYGCQRATGASKRLAVDHDHACCSGRVSCGECVRGLLCGTCNKNLGHYRDDPAAFRRMASYLENHPAQSIREKFNG